MQFQGLSYCAIYNIDYYCFKPGSAAQPRLPQHAHQHPTGQGGLSSGSAAPYLRWDQVRLLRSLRACLKHFRKSHYECRTFNKMLSDTTYEVLHDNYIFIKKNCSASIYLVSA